MKTNKSALLFALFSVPALALAQTNGMKNAVVNLTIIGALAVFVFVIASLATHMGTIAKIMLKKAQDNKKTLSVIGLVGLSFSANAADAVNGPVRFLFEAAPGDSISLYVLIVVFALLLLITLLLSRSMFTMLRLLYGIELKKREAVEVAVDAKTESAWERWLTRWNAAVPVEKEADVMLDHDYDGIKELDNDMPPWWKYGFYLTIVIAFVYFGYYHLGGNGQSQLEEYAVEMKEAEQQKAIAAVTNQSNFDEANLALLTEPAALEHGRSIYAQNCATCHGAKGEGLAGPNL
ncbi:MAG TPA: cbb3-type cytochrome c oxidase N-terminal domain-containing protein, partial [Chitinophagales bacterium]|nr:cbb3-type cytochrome c oxidase N-terminal domain-containing protein [Chitinophagales bacterium]